MLLKNKNAVIYGAGSSVGGTVARAFAAEGAKVFLSGRSIGPVQKVADQINASGGGAEAAVVDALDEKAINDYVAAVAQKAGTIDISFCVIALNDVQNIPLIDMELEDFTRPITIAAQSQLLTAKAAGRVMMAQGRGVILSLTATPAVVSYPLVGGFGPACCVMEALSRNLAAELGIYGIRAVCIRSGGSPDSKPFMDAMANNPDGMKLLINKMEGDTMLKKLPAMADIANVAVFLVSDMANMITGVTVDVTCGTTAGLNYRMLPKPFKNEPASEG